MPDNVTDVLWRRGVLVSIRVRLPRFVKKMHPTDLALDNDVIVPEAYQLGHKKLLSDSALRPLTHLEAVARGIVSGRGHPFPVGRSLYFVTYDALAGAGGVLQRLQNTKAIWEAKKQELCGAYARLVEEQLSTLEEQAQKLVNDKLSALSGQTRDTYERRSQDWLSQQRSKNRQLVRSQQDLERAIELSWSLVRIEGLDTSELLTHLQAAELTAGVQEARDRLTTQLNSWVQQAATDMHRILGTRAAQVARLLQEHGKLTPRNVAPLFEVFESFKALDFTGASQFHEAIDTIRSQFLVTRPDGSVNAVMTAGVINGSDTALGQFREVINSMADLAGEDAARGAGLAALSAVADFQRFIEA